MPVRLNTFKLIGCSNILNSGILIIILDIIEIFGSVNPPALKFADQFQKQIKIYSSTIIRSSFAKVDFTTTYYLMVYKCAITRASGRYYNLMKS